MSTTENPSENLFPSEVTGSKDSSEKTTPTLDKPALTPEEEEVEEDPVEEKEEGADEEDELFTNLEKEEETRLLSSPSLPPQPKDVHAAPKLLQKALEDGQVQASDSEQESDVEKNGSSKAVADEKKDGTPGGIHIHQRVSRRIDFDCWRDVYCVLESCDCAYAEDCLGV